MQGSNIYRNCCNATMRGSGGDSQPPVHNHETQIPNGSQEEAARELVALLGCSMPNAKAILIHYRWNREKVASESKA